MACHWSARVNTGSEYMFQMATITYHTLHGTQEVTLAEDVDYNGETFAEGAELDGSYTFNSYRLTYRYEFTPRGKWSYGEPTGLGGNFLAISYLKISTINNTMFFTLTTGFVDNSHLGISIHNDQGVFTVFGRRQVDEFKCPFGARLKSLELNDYKANVYVTAELESFVLQVINAGNVERNVR